jgi:hypothetical protein
VPFDPSEERTMKEDKYDRQVDKELGVAAFKDLVKVLEREDSLAELARWLKEAPAEDTRVVRFHIATLIQNLTEALKVAEEKEKKP